MKDLRHLFPIGNRSADDCQKELYRIRIKNQHSRRNFVAILVSIFNRGDDMWEQSLIESRAETKTGKKLLFWPIAGFIHGIIVTVLICGSYWHVEALDGPKPLAVFMIPKGLPPALSGGDRIPARPVHNREAAKIVPLSEEPVEETPGGEQQIQGPEEGTPGPGSIDGVVGGIGDEPSSGTGVAEEPVPDQPVIIRADMEKPVLIHRVEPFYPPLALRTHIQGMVLMEAVISKAGDVEGLKILSSPHPLLSAAAMNAVQQWKYRPASLNGKPLSVYFTVTVRFYFR
jgi:TonB family protein